MGKPVLHFTLSTHRLQDDKRIFEVVGMYEPLGLRSPEQAFELNEIDENLVIISQLHDKAFEFYRQRRFSPAAEAFAEAGSQGSLVGFCTMLGFLSLLLVALFISYFE